MTADPEHSSEPTSSAGGRLASLDALRGFDMMFIMGGDSIGHAMEHWKAAETGFLHVLATQLNHEAWAGFRFYDLIFPLFVYMAGISLVFSLTKIVAREGRSAAVKRVIRRGLLLWFIGILVYGGWSKGVDGIRLLGVLQRIGLCYLFAGLLFLYLKPRGLAVALGILLGGYWAAMSFIPMPGLEQVSFEEGKNLANWFDSRFLPFFKWDGTHDPEGILSTLPAIGTCLLGVFTGLFLRDGRTSPEKKAVYLLAAGVGAIVLGHLWGMQFPVIKKLWTSSYVLVAAGWSAILLAVFYWVIDVKHQQKWAVPFIWIGLNPIFIYLLGQVMKMDVIAGYVLGGPIKSAADGLSSGLGDVILSIGGIALSFLICWYLHRRKIYFRV